MYKKIIVSIVFLISLFSVFDYVNATLIDDTRSGMLHASRARNTIFHHISHNQVFKPGDSINFGFTTEIKNPNITCGIVKVTAFLSDIEIDNYGYENFTAPWLSLIGAGHQEGVTASCVDLGNGWSRISAPNMVAEIPSDISESYEAAGVYPVFYRSDGTGGWNTGALSEHIQISFSPCSLPWGGSIASGASVTAYAASSVPCGSSCASQTRTCSNGSLSGSYTNSSCSVVACPCSLPWGGSIASGASVTAYADSSVPCGSTCSSQTRTCSNGTLGGSYTNSSCSIGVCCFCSADYYYVPDYSTTECIGARGVCSSNCKRVTTGSCPDSGIFVPTKTTSEWNVFINNLPSCASVTSCN